LSKAKDAQSKASARFASGFERRRHVSPAGETTESGSQKFVSDGEQIICDQILLGGLSKAKDAQSKASAR
jgi:hypothetical protein